VTLLALGTSISWGQGHAPRDKFVSIVADALGLEVRNYARSGATLWDPRAPRYPQSLAEAADMLPRAPVPARANRADGEVPCAQPYLWAQLLEARAHEQPTVVLIDAGANDVDFVSQVVMPDVRAADVALAVERRLSGNVAPFLRAVRESWPDAAIVLSTYFEAFTSSSDLRRARLSWFLRGILGSCVPDTAITNSMAFRVAFERLHAREVAAVNVLGGKPVLLAVPDFGRDRGMFAPGSLIWECDEHGHAVDTVRIDRILRSHGSTLERLVTARASLGHPNVEGSRAYARAILAALASTT